MEDLLGSSRKFTLVSIVDEINLNTRMLVVDQQER